MIHVGTAAPAPAPRQTPAEIERRDQLIDDLQLAEQRYRIDRAAEQKKVDAAIAAFEKWEKPKRDREDAGHALELVVGYGIAGIADRRRAIEAAAPPVLRVAIGDLRKSMELRPPPKYGFAETAMNRLDALRYVAGDLFPAIKKILLDLHEQDMSVLADDLDAVREVAS